MVSCGRRWVALVVALLAAAGAAAHDIVPGARQERPVLLRGGDLYTVSDGVLRGTDLLFADGEIRAIGRGLLPPEGAEVVDVSGRRVYPGLIAPATSLGLVEIGAVRATSDLSEVGSLTPEAAAHVAYNPDSELIPTVRSHGITTVQVAPAGSLVRGRSAILHLDGWTKEDAAVELTDGLHVRWPAVEVRRGRRRDDTPEKQRERMAAERRELADAFDAAAAYRRARETDPERDLDVRYEALLPVLRGEMPLYVHADDYRQIREAIDFARERDLDLVLVGAKDAWQAIDLLREAAVPVIVDSTMSLPMRDGEDYDAPFRLPAILHEAGIPFSIGHPGSWDLRNLPLQAGHARAFGLSEEAALRAMTLSTAEILGIDDRLGSLEVGKEATLFVSTGDVTDTLGQDVTHVWIRGRPVDLDNRHKSLWRKYRAKPALD